MKKLFILIFCAVALTSCGTIYGAKITDCQKTKPIAGQKQREIRPAALIFDIVFAPVISLPIDFSTGGIYKPCKK
jgi:hypothetical protein